MKEKLRIMVAGAGWLGLPLAEALAADGHRVTATATTEARCAEFRAMGLEGMVLRLGQGQPRPQLPALDVLVVAIPPGRAGEEEALAALGQLAEAAAAAGVGRVVHCSSTAVYPDLCREVGVEDAADFPSPHSGTRLLRLEQVFAQHPVLRTATLRLGGLYGPGRHPSRFVRGVMSGPEHPVNMAPLGLCIAAVRAVIGQDAFPCVRNVVSPEWESRRAFYGRACREAGVPEPQWDERVVAWKRVRPE